MLATFGTPVPNPKQILDGIADRFPFFYPHCLSCYHQVFRDEETRGKDVSVSPIYVQSFDEFESFVCDRGVAAGNVAPLRQHGAIFVRFKSVEDDVTETVVVEKTRTCINVGEIMPVRERENE